MSSTIWKNEKATFDKISEELRTNGKENKLNLGYMPDPLPDRFLTGQRGQYQAKSYAYQTESGDQINFAENQQMACITYIYDNQRKDQVQLCYNKSTNSFGYFLYSSRSGFNRLLAHVSQDEETFPSYRFPGDSYIYGRETAEEKAPTAIENLEKSIADDKVIDEREKPVILNAFKHILAIDKDREITPLSEEEIRIINLENELRREKAKNRHLIDENDDLTQKNDDLNRRNGELQEELDTEKKRTAELETSLESANKNLESAHGMLEKAYDFITRVRESIPGKVFFKKDLANLSMDPTALPKGTQDDHIKER